MSTVTPMMQQYLDIKAQYEDCILFFRLGDFYEMFFKDAQLASKELEITLTGRDCGLQERAPMCGIPFHAANTYIAKLIQKGYKVAICEQVEDATLAKGIVKRDVIRVVTPGTVTDTALLDEKKNHYLMCIYKKSYYYGIAVVDLSTGEFLSTQAYWGNTDSKLMDEIARFSPSEIITNTQLYQDQPLMVRIKNRFDTYMSLFDDVFFEVEQAQSIVQAQFKGQPLIIESLGGKEEQCLQSSAAGALLRYLTQTQRVNLQHIKELKAYKIEEFMVLDIATRRNLELTETMRDKSRKGSLLWVLDRTMTSMGGRVLRKWVEQPLKSVTDIRERLSSVCEFKERFMLRMEVRELLKSVYDIERLIGKIVLGNANCRDLIALKHSLSQVPVIKKTIEPCAEMLNQRIHVLMDSLEDVTDLIENAIQYEPPITLKEGNIIKDGYHEAVDRYREATTKGKDWIAALEVSEREKTGIKNLKVGFNKVFGYYLEVTKSYFHLVPEGFIRKQTLANCERYITNELKEIEDSILGAEEKLVDIEYKLFVEIKDKISDETERIKHTARCIAELDTLCSLAEVADREGYCLPEVAEEGAIEIMEGRHPVVEKMMGQGDFVPNDILLDMEEDRVLIITGPNMAGKSTYMRQTALIVLMAQIGSFVPAASAKIGITDRIFTRVGASDDLASGQSTFMVEMTEVANILSHATAKSLLILDEIGRGTSTYDGLSIAWSVIEFISNQQKIGSRTLFATHYHELTELEGKLSGVKNYCISVKEQGEDIIFLRKIIRGGADGSFGIQVARLAGVPATVIERAKTILKELEDADILKKEAKQKRNKQPMEGQLDLLSFNSSTRCKDEVLGELKGMDVSTLTPLEALNTLYKLQQKLKL